ncbi:MAG: cell wall metabolism sensor histidine kinase WalK [Defluviitaleaceae bacterium]|nr:cell wall metabolism sensor histidine kinase WalK [Defluviitaleaceae bacterium]
MRIFGKQLLFYLGTLIVCFTFLGIVLSQVLRGFLTEQRANELTRLAERVAYSMENLTGYGALFILGQEIRNIHMYTGATVIILDTDFNIFVDYGVPVGAGAHVYEDEIAPVMYGETVAVFGTSNHPALQPLLVVGVPFRIGGEVAGAALVGVSMAELEAAVDEMYRILLFALGVSAVLAFVLHFFTSRAISKPLRQINEAAGEIAGGDFEKRLPVRGKDEISKLAEQFNKMAEGLQEQERIRNAFISNLSHDIRSPLTSMRGFITAIADGTVGVDEQPYYLGIVLDESERLIKLSNDILDIQREATLEKSTFDINDLIRKTILGFSRQAMEKRLMITSRFAHSTDLVEADKDKISRVLHNLLENAVKFTPADGEITVETTETREKVLISVSDNGRGMTSEELKYIFDRFYKGDPSRGEDKMGSGLGLSIVKSFIRAHGETLTVESDIEKGSVFTFTLPLG